MSHTGAFDMSGRSAASSLKRKRLSPSEDPRARAKLNSTTATSAASSSDHQDHSIANPSSANPLTSADSDEMHATDSGDMLHGVGSASSLGSAASSIFSQNSHAFAENRKASLTNGLTPLTNHTDSSPPKGYTPQHHKPTTAMASTNGSDVVSHVPASDLTPQPSQERKPRPQMLPPPGHVKGYRTVWDPELDGKLGKEERKRATLRKREFGTEAYEPDPPPDPRLAIPGYMAGHCRAKHQPSRAILRIAPYNIPPFKLNDKHSIGPGEAQQVVALGFDPFLAETTLRLNFESFGKIASIQNKTDPETGSFLGIALIKFRDSTRDGYEILAVNAAKRAEAEFNGHRIGLNIIKVELDREGRRCKRHVDHLLKKTRDARAKEYGAAPTPIAEAPKPVKDSVAPPLNAPKGPSGKRSAKPPPEGPQSAAAPHPKSGSSSLIEDDLVLSTIKRKPYIHIPHSSVPVLGTTIPHLKKRLKSYDWREVRLDKTGYYVVFEDSKRGEDETERCFNECNNAALFTYQMGMECQKYGNPDYERSPSPERAIVQKREREEIERLQRDEEADMVIERKNRAENLDPVQGALDQLRTELLDKIMGDIKTRIAIPIFHDSLDPSKHVAKRRKLGLPDPADNENKANALLFNKAGESATFGKSRYGHPLSHSKPLRPHDRRGRKGGKERDSGNAFIDERRRKPPPRPSHARGLHYRLQQMFAEEEDSDDERQTSLTRDTEDLESRPLSRTSRTSTPADSESVADTPKSKRRKVNEWDDEEKETFGAYHKAMLGDLLLKEPEDLATRELELVVSQLPRDSKYATRAKTELFIRQRSKADDDLFRTQTEAKNASSEPWEAMLLRKEQESTPSVDLDFKAVKEKPKRKRKTKKQLLEEQEALKAEARKAKAASKPVAPETTAKIEQKELELEAVEEPEDKDITFSVTYDKPRRTVEDDRSLILDIDGWQRYLKDDEDMTFALKVLAEEAACDIGDAKFWAWKQKEIKALNSGEPDATQPKSLIQGYYVPNPSGCARTEGVQKILNEEKSKYLPHRIKVQRAREERQAEATADPTAAAEAARIAVAEKIASTATSRSNRVNNRRLINDINLQKQSLSTDADVAVRFNQLKKRKKLVKFDRSAIHGWGLYAEENIAINDLIIEYVGEKVRQKVADMREIKYEKQGVGSSYLFRMMDDEIVDATKKGGIARFINHSCNPNCTAKIIKVEGTPRIVIYALKDIQNNDELTYDYKFEREYGATDRIPCLCGSANCKGFLN